MGSLGGEFLARKKAMWMLPKMMGAKPSERWGHSACYFNGLVYIFGGCRGGMHFSDVLVCDISTMTWNILKTSGPSPGPRDSHSAVLVGHRMLIFGGTNGSKKVNDLHMLDLISREWTRPECRGNPPSARESHTTNVVGDEKLILFGGSGEGEANYLNDLHILDLKNMEWSLPEVRGSVPAPRDSHSSVVVGNRLFVFGGDSGDRYQGDVSVFDVNKMIWYKMDVYGPSPSARAGHASVSIGTKMYVLSGVGDKKYYNDIWVLDVVSASWLQLETCPQKLQGKFSHTANVTNVGIAVFGGCGEDERPLNEFLVLQIDRTKMILNTAENNLTIVVKEDDDEDSTSQDFQDVKLVPKHSFQFSSDMLHPKRRRTSNSELPEKEVENDESCSSQQSSQSRTDKEKKQSIRKTRTSSGVYHPLSRQKVSALSNFQACKHIPLDQTNPNGTSRISPDTYVSANQMKQECVSSSVTAGKSRHFVGAEVRGQVDGAFDSGYLMTATVNGKIFRGVLFAPGPVVLGQCPSRLTRPVAEKNFICPRKVQSQTRRSSQQEAMPLDWQKESMADCELQGVVLTLASPSPGVDLGPPPPEKLMNYFKV